MKIAARMGDGLVAWGYPGYFSSGMKRRLWARSATKCSILKGTRMKKPVALALLTLLVVGVSFGQTPTAGTEKKAEVRGQGGITEAVIAREEGFWDARKNRRADFFKENVAAESIVVAGGTADESGNARRGRKARMCH